MLGNPGGQVQILHNRITALEAEQAAHKQETAAENAEVQARQARKEALIAEREALRNAAHENEADREQCRHIVGDIDAQLNDLRENAIAE